MKLARQRFWRYCAAVWFLLLVVGAGWGQTVQTGANSTTPQLKLAFAAWEKGEYAAAVAEFEKVIEQDPDNPSLHTEFVDRVVRDTQEKSARFQSQQRIARMWKEQAEKAQAEPGGKQAKSEEQTQKAEAPPPTAAAALPPPKTPQELAKMEKDSTDAQTAVSRLQQLYEQWAKENPKRALYPFELAALQLAPLLDSKEFEKREQYLLSAVALEKKFTDAYSGLAKLYSGSDDHAAAEYARKALETKPGDAKLQLGYASLLWKVDPAAARKIYGDQITKNAGTQTGADALTAFIDATEDEKEKVALIEQYRREYRDRWKPLAYLNSRLFEAYVTAEPAKGLAFAQEILKGIESDKPETNSSGRMLKYLKIQWKESVDYAQALVQTRSLRADKKYTDAVALLEKTKLPGFMEDNSQLVLLLVLLKAEAADGAGDTAKAYDMIATPLLKAMDTSLQSALVKYGTKLGKSAEQVDQDLWARRMQKAESFKTFDLKKLGAEDRLKLADLCGKVVMVDFWFPSCHECRVEFPHLQKLVEKYGSEGFVLVTINNNPADEATGQLMVSKQKYGFVNLQAPEWDWVSKTYGVRGFPTTYVLDADGKAIFFHLGYTPEHIQQMDAEIAALLARAAKNKNNRGAVDP